MPIITRKIELKIVKDGLTDEEYDQQWKYLYQINKPFIRLPTESLLIAFLTMSMKCD